MQLIIVYIESEFTAPSHFNSKQLTDVHFPHFCCITLNKYGQKTKKKKYKENTLDNNTFPHPS